jgi:glycosyltransferase involved in cell wall biosynthesis
MPLVSAITAAYRSDPAHLRATLQSALNQSYPNLEVVVSDDSPTDGLRTLVEELQDPRLRYFHNSPALGVAANHWRSFKRARGELIAILNHDDTYEPEFCERLVAPLVADTACAVAFCDHWIVDAAGQRLEAVTESASHRYGRASLSSGRHLPFMDLLACQAVSISAGAIFRRSALPDILPLQAGPAYDLWLAYLLCRTGQGAWYVPERLSSWRLHAMNQTSRGDISLLRGAALCWTAIARDSTMRPIGRVALKKAAGAFCACARWHGIHGQPKESLECARRALDSGPSWRALAHYALALARRLGNLGTQGSGDGAAT